MKYLAQYFIYLAAAFSQLLIKKQNRARSLALGGGKWNRDGGISICVEFLLNSLIRGFRKSRARSWIKLDFIPPELNFRMWIYTISDMEACLSNNCCIFFTIKAWRPFTSWLKLMVFTVTSSDCKVKKARFYEFFFTLGWRLIGNKSLYKFPAPKHVSFRK